MSVLLPNTRKALKLSSITSFQNIHFIENEQLLIVKHSKFTRASTSLISFGLSE